MNVFVLSTGRCGSTTFARACEHIENYSSAHESRMRSVEGRVRYPSNHIEIDNRLSWFLGRLDKLYGDDAFYVHMKRDRDAVAKSHLRRYEKGIIKAYKERIIWRADERDVPPIEVCRHYVDTVNSNIALFLEDKTQCMELRLKSAKEDFREFWDRVGAVGNRSKALCEWEREYNASNRGKRPSAPSLPARAANKVARVVRKLPYFLKEA
ncbi:MAG: hypothetical protein BRD53_02230 [Bacteroidetes bacterium SW_7_64_58]|nr:MAG: hypothetical protein BRD53_02230 [Bacteroidetes bacterium SW_7_64_58]